MSNPNYQSNSARYVAPKSTQMTQLQGQVDEVTGIMKDNIRLELERGGKLDDLEAKTEILNEGSRQFSVTSKKLKQKYWWKNLRMWIYLIIIVLVLIAIITIIAVVATPKKK